MSNDQDKFFKSMSSDRIASPSQDPYQGIVNGEIEYDPRDLPEPSPKIELTEVKTKEWENIDMFSSKKFSDIMAKHKKIKRYHDSIDNDDESFMDIQSNRKNDSELQIVDLYDDGDKSHKDQRTYDRPKDKRFEYSQKTPLEKFDKIRKTDPYTVDLPKSINNDSAEPSGSKASAQKIFTTSINLMDFDTFSGEKEEFKESKTHDCREDSLTKAPKWNFIGSNRENNLFEAPSTSKKVIIDDFEEFKYDNESQDDQEEDQNNSDNNSCCINEDLGDDDQYLKLENVSVFEEAEGEQIPFDMDDEDIEEEQDEDQETHQEGENTLKQMRMLFGSEQKIREQSEAAIQNLNHGMCDFQEEEESEPEELRTPGLSQSQNKNHNTNSKSNVFDRSSFQDFSMKKFQEIMFENNISDFMSSVERTVRQNTNENLTHRTHQGKSVHEKSITPKKGSNFVSPRKFSRKELELDRIVGSKMKFMSEKKRQRKSMLDSDSTIIHEFPQDPLNRSLDIYKSKFANYTSNQVTRNSKPKMVGSDVNMPFNSVITQGHNKKVEVERTEQVFIKAKLMSDGKNSTEPVGQKESIKRSDVRGLDQLLSEKSQDFEEKENRSIIQDISEENRTLRYGTDDRTDRSGSAKSKKSQKDQIYGQLEKIMTN